MDTIGRVQLIWCLPRWRGGWRVPLANNGRRRSPHFHDGAYRRWRIARVPGHNIPEIWNGRDICAAMQRSSPMRSGFRKVVSLQER